LKSRNRLGTVGPRRAPGVSAEPANQMRRKIRKSKRLGGAWAEESGEKGWAELYLKYPS